jgi:hypothetical protein
MPEVLSLCNFVKASQATSYIDIALIIIYYKEKMEYVECFFSSDLNLWFNEARVSSPANFSDIISKSITRHFLIPEKSSPKRYRLSQRGIDYIEKTLEINKSPKKNSEETSILKDISESLYNSLVTIPDLDERGYIQEALTCLSQSIKAYRASILMGWAGAIYHLRKKVEKDGFDKFYREYGKLFPSKTKSISNIDDFEHIKEKDFLLVIEKMGIIDKAIRTQLENCLNLRNDCGHPTQVKPKIHKVRSFFEDIIQYALSR